MEIFEGNKPNKIVGIDENGYGPVLGPLVVTGVLLKSKREPFDLKIERFRFPIKIKDSKKIFTRTKSSYFAGEIIAHSIFEAAGLKVRSFYELINALTDNGIKEVLRASVSDSKIYRDFSLPVWVKEVRQSFKETLENLNIELFSIHCEVVLPYKFNQLLKEHDNKTSMDFFLFFKILDKLTSGGETALLGKIGSTKYYASFFEKVGIILNETINETRGISSYQIKLNNKKMEIHFIMDGDEVYLPITFASIVGKYVRELFMLALNKFLGHNEIFPWASGYRHDHKTWILIEEWRKKMPDMEKAYLIREK